MASKQERSRRCRWRRRALTRHTRGVSAAAAFVEDLPPPLPGLMKRAAASNVLYVPKASRRALAAAAPAEVVPEPPPEAAVPPPPPPSSYPEYRETAPIPQMIPRRPPPDPVPAAPAPSNVLNHWADAEDTTALCADALDPAEEDAFLPHGGRGRRAGTDEMTRLVALRDHARSPAERAAYDRRIARLRGREAPGSRHWSTKSTAAMALRDWRIFREDHGIVVKGVPPIPPPLRTWDEGGRLPPWVLAVVRGCGYRAMSPIQMQAIPVALAGRDLIGVAETGSGKTAAFVIPILVDLVRRGESAMANAPRALVLSPTRELALQTEVEMTRFAAASNTATPLHVLALIGGAEAQPQISALQRGAHVVVATPGRLLDLMQQCHVDLTGCRTVVLDEGDQMVDLGFEAQLKEILEAIGPDAATLVFSATMPPPIASIVAKHCRRSPVTVQIGEGGRAAARVKQVVEVVRGDKAAHLRELLLHGPPPPIIVFLAQRASCDAIAAKITRWGLRAGVLHSGKTQEHRESVLRAFRDRAVDVLVATNVAGRGLDVQGVTHVINYDLPRTIEEYTHRVGRTGRAGAAGLATSFFTRDDVEIAPGLRDALITASARVPRELTEVVRGVLRGGGSER